MAYSEDLRKKAIEYLAKGHSQREAQRVYGIGLSAINKWHQKYQKTGELKDPPPRRSFRKLDPEKLKAYVNEHPDAYLKEIGEAFNCSDTAVLKALRQLGITRKKTKRYDEQKPEQVAMYMAQIVGIPISQIAYVDETGIDTCLYREYGWSGRGVPLMGVVRGHKFQRMGIVAAQMGESILAPLTYDGTMDSLLFETWFENHLLPALPEKTVIVMDNASSHRKSKLFDLALKAGHLLLFLPPYSPELNPIENFWSWLKRHLRKILPFHRDFHDAVRSAFQVCLLYHTIILFQYSSFLKYSQDIIYFFLLSC